MNYWVCDLCGKPLGDEWVGIALQRLLSRGRAEEYCREILSKNPSAYSSFEECVDMWMNGKVVILRGHVDCVKKLFQKYDEVTKTLDEIISGGEEK